MTHRVLDGLPPYGPGAVPFPAEWGGLGREGMVVEFTDSSGERWTGNFRRGLGGLDGAMAHPDGRQVIVFAGGDAWSVDPDLRVGTRFARAIDARWPMSDGMVLSRQGLAFLRVGPGGIEWHTRRLSWDGFKDVCLVDQALTALAWSPLEDRWIQCSVDLRTGRADGGSFAVDDTEGWESLAHPPSQADGTSRRR